MKKLLFFLLIVVASLKIHGQQVYLEIGEVVSSFDYEDSQGTALGNLQPTQFGFMSLGYRSKFFVRNLYATAGADFHRYGAIGSDRALDNFMEWELTTLGASFGLDYEFLNQGGFRFYARGSFHSEFLIKGAQTLKHQVYDLVNESDFNRSPFFFRGGLGVSHSISDTASVFVEYKAGRSLVLKEDSLLLSEPEKLRIITHSFGFGILIDTSRFGRLCNW